MSTLTVTSRPARAAERGLDVAASAARPEEMYIRPVEIDQWEAMSRRETLSHREHPNMDNRKSAAESGQNKATTMEGPQVALSPLMK
jgi:hypothetical protein